MSSDFSEFLSQPFISGILSLMCFVTLLLIATIAGIVYMRRRKAQQNLVVVPPPSFVGESAYSTANMDMPDLNLLMHTPAAAPKPAPVVRSAPPPPVPVSAPAPQRPARKGTFAVTPRDASATEAVEVLSLLRDVVDGSLIVQMGDKAYQNVNSDPEFKDKFNRLMRELGQLMTKPAVEITEQQMETAASDVETVDLPSASEAVEVSEPSFVAPKKSAAPPPTYDGRMPGDLPSFKLDDNPMRKLKRGQKPSEVSPVPELNIAGAIEAYLQYKLTHSSMYGGRSIHIYPAPGGGVSIEVDGQYFDAVSDVTDSSVREFLSETIAEWQERH
ncbi:MAG: hypothetical protein LCI00_17930 [Chloroflexi bacterium]|nr:hypothetical protein [Chloroflexota bacterium]MCC6893856.1 hypothetical protein [Anaerolineae bacterium]